MHPMLFAARPAWALAALLAGGTCAVFAQDSDRADWLRNPAMGNYKAYAEFKMANYGLAREVWQTLAELGNGDALFNLAILAEDGLGEPRDMVKAEALYTSAARAGNFKAQYRLGMLYSTGQLLPFDSMKARTFLTLASQGGDRDALAALAALDLPSTARSPFQEAEWQAAQGQHHAAGVLYRQLSDQGDAVARTRLAWMHEAGRGVQRDLAEAARLFALSAQAGDAEAQYALAVMYRTGRGRPADRGLSLQWLERAAAQSHPAAREALTSLRSSGPP